MDILYAWAAWTYARNKIFNDGSALSLKLYNAALDCQKYENTILSMTKGKHEDTLSDIIQKKLEITRRWRMVLNWRINPGKIAIWEELDSKLICNVYFNISGKSRHVIMACKRNAGKLWESIQVLCVIIQPIG